MARFFLCLVNAPAACGEELRLVLKVWFLEARPKFSGSAKRSILRDKSFSFVPSYGLTQARPNQNKSFKMFSGVLKKCHNVVYCS
jgi:hypothetical protein